MLFYNACCFELDFVKSGEFTFSVRIVRITNLWFFIVPNIFDDLTDIILKKQLNKFSRTTNHRGRSWKLHMNSKLLELNLVKSPIAESENFF